MLLLILSAYLYYCLSNSMIKYENNRMNYIINKERKLKTREMDINLSIKCQNQNILYEKAIDNISNIAQKRK
jgi:hypothetical protein